jgi:hypothetical protein
VRGFNPRLESSGCSYATVHQPERSKIKQVQAEKELLLEEELNFRRMVEAKGKKSIEKKKSTKNLIWVRHKGQEELLSEKEFEGDGKEKADALNQSMMDKLNPPKRNTLPAPEPIRVPKAPEQDRPVN